MRVALALMACVCAGVLASSAGATPGVPAPTPIVFSGIVCTGEFCAGLGDYGQIATTTDPSDDAGAWQTFRLPGYSGYATTSLQALQPLSCPAAGTCALVGGDAVWFSTNASGGPPAWHETTLELPANPFETNGLTAIACPSTSLCVAGDTTGDVFVTTDPAGPAGGWSMITLPGAAEIQSVSCPSTSFCAVLESSGSVVSTEDPTGGAAAWVSEPAIIPPAESDGLGYGSQFSFEDLSCTVAVCVVTESVDAYPTSIYHGTVLSWYVVPVAASAQVTGSAPWSWQSTTLPVDDADDGVGPVDCTPSVCVADGGAHIYASSDPTGMTGATGATGAWTAVGADAGDAPIACPTATQCLIASEPMLTTPDAGASPALWLPGATIVGYQPPAPAPTVQALGLTGLRSGRPSLTLDVFAQDDTPELTSLIVTLPHGLRFAARRALRRHLKLDSGLSDRLLRKPLLRVHGSTLSISGRSPFQEFSAELEPGAILTTARFARTLARAKGSRSLRLTMQVTTADHLSHSDVRIVRVR